VRQVVLDTETTGLDPALGHRVIELACVEMVNRRLTGRTFHRYVNPQRASDPGALEVHGLTEEFLSDKPLFRDLAAEFLEFVRDAELVIHNAPFDVGFLDAELRRLDLPGVAGHASGVLDTLRLARELHPGKRNSLDALCERYGVDNSARTLHGALLDARLLAEAYLAMTRGQESLVMDLGEEGSRLAALQAHAGPLDLVVVRASDAEREAHARYLEDLDKASKGKCVWKALPDAAPSTTVN
jgi:DNA polymerase-3 subunit epsilon